MVFQFYVYCLRLYVGECFYLYKNGYFIYFFFFVVYGVELNDICIFVCGIDRDR